MGVVYISFKDISRIFLKNVSSDTFPVLITVFVSGPLSSSLWIGFSGVRLRGKEEERQNCDPGEEVV